MEKQQELQLLNSKMYNFFFRLYHQFQEMDMNGKNMDSMLNALPWKERERLPDGTIIYECKIKVIFDKKIKR